MQYHRQAIQHPLRSTYAQHGEYTNWHGVCGWISVITRQIVRIVVEDLFYIVTCDELHCVNPAEFEATERVVLLP